MADPGDRHFRLTDDRTQAAISITDDDGTDRHDDLVALVVGDRIVMRSTQTGGEGADFTITTLPTDLTTWVLIDVSLTASQGTEASGNDRILFDFLHVLAPAAIVGWAGVEEVTDALGVPVTDPDHLQRCVDASNAFCYRRRQKAGYIDLPDVSPGPDATMAAILYATTLYRERGSVDSFASFDAFAAGAIPSGSMGQVLRLLGTPRPAVDRPPSPDEVAATRLARSQSVFAYRGIR
jgi:hypothetical protein